MASDDNSVAPNMRGAQFTLPAIRMPDGSYVMDSYKIAEIIEEKHPVPSIPLNQPIQFRFIEELKAFMGELTPIYVPGVAQRILGDPSLDFFYTSREQDVGMPLDDYGKQHGPGAFDRAEPFIRKITELLKEAPSGPYFLGDTVSYTDFIWAAILLFFKCLGDEEYQEVLRTSGDSDAHIAFLNALKPWTERNDR